MDRRRANQLIPAIYEATIKPEYWEKFLQLLCEVTQSKSSCISYSDTSSSESGSIAHFGCSLEMVRQLTDSHNTKTPIMLRHKQLNQTEEEATAAQFYEGSANEVYISPDFEKSWMRPNQVYYIGGRVILDELSRQASISLHREKDQGNWGSDDLDILNEIAPHLRRALNIHAEFTRLKLQQDALLKGLDKLVIGLILFNSRADVVYINPTARSIIESHPALSISGHRLAAFDRQENETLQRTIKEVANIDPEDSWRQSVGIGLTHPDISIPLPLLVTPMHAHQLTSELEYEGAKVAAFLSDPNQTQPISADSLISVYNLSPAEAHVAIGIANGLSIEEIASSSHHSTHTIRSHLKSTFRKIGVSRQSELVKILLSSPFAHRRRSSSSKTTR